MKKLISSSFFNRYLFFAVPRAIRFFLFVFAIPIVIILNYGTGSSYIVIWLIFLFVFILSSISYSKAPNRLSNLYFENGFFRIDNSYFKAEDVKSIIIDKTQIVNGRIIYNLNCLILEVVNNNSRKFIRYKVLPKFTWRSLISLGYKQENINPNSSINVIFNIRELQS